MEVPSIWTCLICGHSQDNVAYVTPCFHQLCYGCAPWWAKKLRCAIYGHKISTIQYSVRSDDDYLECPILNPTAHSGNGLQDVQGPAKPVLIPTKHNFLPEVWAAFSQKHPGDNRSLLRWLKQEMSWIISDEWWDVHAKQNIILGFICKYGLDEATSLQKLQPNLRGFTAHFVKEAHYHRCSPVWPRDLPAARPPGHLCCRRAGGQPPDSGVGHSTSPADPSTDELPGIFCGGSEHITTPMSSEELQEEPGHAGAVGSSMQCRDCSSGGSQSPLKRPAAAPRLAPTLQDAALAAALSQNPSQTTTQADWEASGRWL